MKSSIGGHQQLNFFIHLAKAQAAVARRFGMKLSAWGMGFNEFIILYHLSQAHDEKLRRIDLADKIGLTASGVTRILLPMEKIGLVQTEESTQDARVKFVALAPGGKRVLEEANDHVEILAQEWLAPFKLSKVQELDNMITTLGIMQP